MGQAQARLWEAALAGYAVTRSVDKAAEVLFQFKKAGG
jgi:hypothetical protein